MCGIKNLCAQLCCHYVLATRHPSSSDTYSSMYWRIVCTQWIYCFCLMLWPINLQYARLCYYDLVATKTPASYVRASCIHVVVILSWKKLLCKDQLISICTTGNFIRASLIWAHRNLFPWASQSRFVFNFMDLCAFFFSSSHPSEKAYKANCTTGLVCLQIRPSSIKANIPMWSGQQIYEDCCVDLHYIALDDILICSPIHWWVHSLSWENDTQRLYVIPLTRWDSGEIPGGRGIQPRTRSSQDIHVHQHGGDPILIVIVDDFPQRSFLVAGFSRERSWW
jgi:hypothetical protein